MFLWLERVVVLQKRWEETTDVKPPILLICVKQWHRPDLLLIGDAAHVISLIGGVGLVSIQDKLSMFSGSTVSTIVVDSPASDRRAG